MERHLLVSSLSDGDFAGVTNPRSPCWAQTKRIGDRWVVVPTEGDDVLSASLSTGALGSHQAVADVVWGWPDGALREDFAPVEAPRG